MKAVRITIDLNNPNQKPQFEFWQVTKESENYIHAKAKYEVYGAPGRRIYKNSLDQIHFPKKLVYTYDFTTDIEDYFEIEKSEKVQKIMLEIKKKIESELDYYRRHINGTYNYYIKNF